MTKSDDYRMYLEERFNSLTTLVNAQSEVTHEWLEKLEAHAARTNGRVHDLENKLIVVEKDILTHPMRCNKAKDIDKINIKVDDVVKDLEEYRMLKKYPKLIVIVITFLVIGILISAYGTFKTIHSEKAIKIVDQRVENLGTPTIVGSRGEIKQLPPGDSLKFFRDGEFKDTMK
jgi:hypothetical protein